MIQSIVQPIIVHHICTSHWVMHTELLIYLHQCSQHHAIRNNFLCYFIAHAGIYIVSNITFSFFHIIYAQSVIQSSCIMIMLNIQILISNKHSSYIKHCCSSTILNKLLLYVSRNIYINVCSLTIVQ